MTLPYERTRAIIKTEEFLRELSRDRAMPEEIRYHAKSLLRHYPSADQVFSLGRFEETVCNDTSNEELRRRVVALHEPLLSSTLESAQ